MAAIAPGLHTAPPATLFSWVRTGAPVPTYTTTDLVVRAPRASDAMKEISCSPRSAAGGVHSKAPVLVSNADPCGKAAAVMVAALLVETRKRMGTPGLPATLPGASTCGPAETTARVSRTVLSPERASRVAFSSAASRIGSHLETNRGLAGFREQHLRDLDTAGIAGKGNRCCVGCGGRD